MFLVTALPLYLAFWRRPFGGQDTWGRYLLVRLGFSFDKPYFPMLATCSLQYGIRQKKATTLFKSRLTKQSLVSLDIIPEMRKQLFGAERVEMVGFLPSLTR